MILLFTARLPIGLYIFSCIYIYINVSLKHFSAHLIAVFVFLFIFIYYSVYFLLFKFLSVFNLILVFLQLICFFLVLIQLAKNTNELINLIAVQTLNNAKVDWLLKLFSNSCWKRRRFFYATQRPYTFATAHPCPPQQAFIIFTPNLYAALVASSWSLRWAVVIHSKSIYICIHTHTYTQMCSPQHVDLIEALSLSHLTFFSFQWRF